VTPPFSETPTQPSNHRWRTRIAWLFLAGLVCRLALVALEPAARLRGDERTWLALALHQVANPSAAFDPLRSELLFYPPLHPWVVAGAHALGGGLVAVKLVQALLGAVFVPVVGLVGRRAIGPRTGLVAAAFTAFYPTLVWYSAHFWSEPLFLVLLWWGLERALAADEGRRGAAVASGILLGLAALTRELPLYFVPILAAWLLSRRDRRGLVRAIVLVVATAAVVAPWTLRNWVRFDAFVPVSTMGGRALWEGNTTGDRGAVYAEHDRLVREEGPVAAYRDAMGRGLQSIRERQPRWILDKTLHEVEGLFTPNNMVLVHIEKRGYGMPRPLGTWAAAVVTLVPYVGLMVLFIMGLARLSWNRPLVLLLLFLLFYVMLHVVVHGHHRFRLALLPVIFTIGASVLPGVEKVATAWTPRRRLVAVVLGLAFGASAWQAVSGFLREPAFVGRRVSIPPDLGARATPRPRHGDDPPGRRGDHPRGRSHRATGWVSPAHPLGLDFRPDSLLRVERPPGRGPIW
jgi:4-amino-4-deoxy-L-arabinose transferase-like glycosyltransferase